MACYRSRVFFKIDISCEKEDAGRDPTVYSNDEPPCQSSAWWNNVTRSNSSESRRHFYGRITGEGGRHAGASLEEELTCTRTKFVDN